MNTNLHTTKKELLERIQALELTIQLLRQEKEEAQRMAEIAYECFEKVEKKYHKSVRRELSYREMLFVFNHQKAKQLLQDYISRDGLRVQFYSPYNFRSN